MARRTAIALRAIIVALVIVIAAPSISVADPGDPDSSFGTDGATVTDFGFADTATANDIGGAVVVDGSGRVVVAGLSGNAYGQGLAVARYATNGSLDASFGHLGRVVVKPDSVTGGGSQRIGLAVDGSSRIVAFSNSQGRIAGVRLLDDGTLDPSFGAGGIASVAVGQYAWTEDLALDASGRVVIVGGVYDYGTAEYDTVVVRLSLDGSLDPTFGVGGVTTLDLGPLDFGRAIGVNAAGIYVAGGSNDDFFVARYTDSGVLDPAFGTGGLAVSDLGGSQETAFGLAIDGTGRIVIGGTTVSTNADIGLARYDAFGNLDPTFDGDGIVITDAGPSPGYSEGIRDLAIDGLGRIVGSGWAHPGGSYDAIAVRYLDGGSLDATFAGDGLAELGTAAEERAEGVAVDGAAVTVAGWEYGSNADFKVFRLDGVGVPDPSWNGTGIAVTDMGPGHSRTEYLYDLAELPDGRLVAGGGSAPDGSNADVALALYEADGSLDMSFGADGRAMFDLGGWDEAYGVAVQPGLGILAAGYVDDELFVLRAGFDGVLDPSFGTAGIVRFAIGSFAYAWDVAVDSAGRVVLAGEGGGSPRVIRLLADGAFDPTFGTGGQAVLPGPGYAASIDFDSLDRIVAAIDSASDVKVVRLTDAGVPDPSFSGDGVAVIVGPDYDRSSEAIVDATDRVVIAGQRVSGQVLLARLDTSGAPDATFDGDGVLTLPALGSIDLAAAAALQADGAIVFAGFTAGTNPADFLIGRVLDDGSLDTTFSSDGLVIDDFGATDLANAVLIGADGRIVAAGYGGLASDFLIARYETAGGPDTASGTATPASGGSASTGTDPTPSDPVETTVTVPPGTDGGPISITESAPTIPPPTGYTALGLEVQISAPAGTAANPLELTFLFDEGAALAAGVDETTIQLLRNGVPVANCSTTGPISPDPCLVERSRTVDNDIRIRALTSAASAWSLASRAPFTFTGFLQPVDNLPIQNTVKAGSAVPVKFSLGGNKGFDIFAATYPRSVEIACGETTPQDAIEQTSSAGASSLSYDAGTGTYTYTWKTDKKWASTCRQLVLRFADGTYQRATFKFTK